MRLDEIEVKRWGERIGETVNPPVVIALKGPLGAGKSVLARAIGFGAGVRDAMPSPSHSLVLTYPISTDVKVVHLDLYRLESPDELGELGWSQLGADGEIVLLEWPERANGKMPRNHWVIELSVPDGHPQLRDVEVHRVGSPPALAAFPMSLFASGK